ncbi:MULTISPECIES: tRNA uracil 4-sulfurtransferase ThiI [Granulicatella]|uniref:tRNA uracil 4-sulfurtransferase ThiI n=1 Tax=Granulicatella TaxID=117563 RepID=UPI0008A58E58|nr:MULTISPECIES: tRNA uracil 4-sulfurtransferase ThiI [Granulicatella]OFS99909.1 tRNA 4-thiouridine(8) synthase ThiI [Granulicatella sp. HMSC31F03]UXY40657.1 tRNA 4-thiouridine(8) synthase ThiI [Granulicatella adiacens]
MKTRILIRYGELSTKGRNKKMFTQKLASNIKKALVDFPQVKVIPDYDFMYLDLHEAPEEAVIEKVKPIFGIQSISPVYIVEKDMEVAKKVVLDLLSQEDLEGKTFKIMTKRSDHTFEMDTNQINLFLGDAVLEAFPDIKVQLKQPDITVRIDVRREHLMVSLKTIPGAGGLPVGTSGRVMLMLSGGIDSPVAGYLAMKRGMEIQCVHFASPPYTSPQALEKTKLLAAKIARFGGSIQFLTVPFSRIQEEIKKSVPEAYLMTIMRRFMLRITDELRKNAKALAIANGESVGQVASQTLESMVAINDVTNTPIIRPVATMDKLDIIKVAEEIDTFELSIQPFEDCCTVFAPPSPKTKPKLEKARQYEARLDVEGLIREAVEGTVIEEITANYTTAVETAQQEIDDLF